LGRHGRRGLKRGGLGLDISLGARGRGGKRRFENWREATFGFVSGGGPRQQQGWATRDPPRDTNFISVALAKADWRDASDLR
jgi:hypothetical protein